MQQVTYGDTANSILCGFGPRYRGYSASLAGCDNDWQTWWVGSRTQWNVTKDFYMGVDVLYTKIESANYWTFYSHRRWWTVCEHRTCGRRASLLPSQTSTTGRSASASIATSIRDRMIVDL